MELEMEQGSEELLNLDDALAKAGVTLQTMNMWIEEARLVPVMVNGDRAFRMSELDTINECRAAAPAAWRKLLPWQARMKARDEERRREMNEKWERDRAERASRIAGLGAPVPAAPSAHKTQTTDDIMKLAKDLLRAGQKEFAYRAFELAAQND